MAGDLLDCAVFQYSTMFPALIDAIYIYLGANDSDVSEHDCDKVVEWISDNYECVENE